MKSVHSVVEQTGLEVIIIIQVKESFIQFYHVFLVFPERQAFEQWGDLILSQLS